MQDLQRKRFSHRHFHGAGKGPHDADLSEFCIHLPGADTDPSRQCAEICFRKKRAVGTPFGSCTGFV